MWVLLLTSDGVGGKEQTTIHTFLVPTVYSITALVHLLLLILCRKLSHPFKYSGIEFHIYHRFIFLVR